MSELEKKTEFIVTSEAMLPEVAQQIMNALGKHRKITFSGEIGAGKTTLIQVLCRVLGVKEEVTSPSFALVNEYQIPGKEGHLIRHIDLYRLESPEEAWEIGLEEYLYDSHYCFIEWPELISTWLPEETFQVVLEVLPNSDRKVIFL